MIAAPQKLSAYDRSMCISVKLRTLLNECFPGGQGSSAVPLGRVVAVPKIMSRSLLTPRQDPDSDSDFNPGSFIPEAKKRPKKSSGSRKAGEPPRKKRRRDTLDGIGGLSGGSEAHLTGKTT